MNSFSNPVSAEIPLFVIEQYGESGTENGQFSSPTNVIRINNQYYVADYSNHRVQVFNLDWTYQNQFGGLGSGLGQLSGPIDLYFNGSHLFVLEYVNHRISVFLPNGNFVTSFGEFGTGNGQFNYPSSMVIHEGIIYVTEYSGERFQLFNESTFDYISKYTTTGSQLIGIDISDTLIFIVDVTNGIIRYHDLATRAFKGDIGINGNDIGMLLTPIQVRVVNDYVIVSDQGPDKIVIMDKLGNVVKEVFAGSNSPYLFDVMGNMLMVPYSNSHHIKLIRITPNPSNVIARSSNTGIQLSWGINNAEGIVDAISYNIYRDSGSGKEFIGTSISQSFFDHSTELGVDYTYYVESNSILGVSDQTSSNETSILEGNNGNGIVTVTDDGGGAFDNVPITVYPFILALVALPILRKRK